MQKQPVLLEVRMIVSREGVGAPGRELWGVPGVLLIF